MSLFISLLVLVLGNKNHYCLCFGFVLLGLSFAVYVLYNEEKTSITIAEIYKQIEEIENNESLNEDDLSYALQELYLREAKLLKRKKKVAFTFYLSAALFVLLGIVGIF